MNFDTIIYHQQQLLVLVLPFVLGDSDLLGDVPQLAPGFITLRLEPACVSIAIARAGGVGTAGRSRGVAHLGRGRGWCRSGVPLGEPGNTKRVVRNKKNSRKSCEEIDDHHLRRAPARLPSASSLAQRLLLLPTIELFGVLVLEKRSLDWQRLESRGFGERLGEPEVLIYGTGKEIVARDRGAYPEKFGRWRDSLNRIVVESFGIQAGLYSV
jgi:hypothetical protein